MQRTLILFVALLAISFNATAATDSNGVVKRNAYVLQEKGQKKFAAGEYQQALNYYRQGIALNPDCKCTLFPLHVGSGQALTELNKLDEAMEQFNIALEMAPLSEIEIRPELISIGHESRGQVFYMFKDYKAALADFSQAVKLAPGNSLPREWRGVTYRFLGEYANAMTDYNWVLERNPGNLTTRDNRAWLHTQMENYDQAIKDYDILIGNSPERAMFWNDRSYVYLTKGMYEKAMSDINTALELDSNLVIALENRISVFVYTARYKEAVADWNRVIALVPNKGENYLSRSICLEKIDGPIDQILTDLNRAEALGVKSKDLYYTRGLALKKAGDLQKALLCFNQAIQIDPKWIAPHTQLAITHMKAGEVVNSIVCWATVIAMYLKQI